MSFFPAHKVLTTFEILSIVLGSLVPVLLLIIIVVIVLIIKQKKHDSRTHGQEQLQASRPYELAQSH